MAVGQEKTHLASEKSSHDHRSSRKHTGFVLQLTWSPQMPFVLTQQLIHEYTVPTFPKICFYLVCSYAFQEVERYNHHTSPAETGVQQSRMTAFQKRGGRDWLKRCGQGVTIWHPVLSAVLVQQQVNNSIKGRGKQE